MIDTRQDTFDADGIARVVFGPVGNMRAWLVQRIVVQTDSDRETVALVYVGDPVPHNIADGTTSGNLDVADEAQPIEVGPGASLIVEWTGGTPGRQANAVVQLVEMAGLN